MEKLHMAEVPVSMEKPHIALVPGAGFTHLAPILEFSKRLLHLHQHFHITCLIPSLGSTPSASKSYVETLPPTIHSIFLPPISTEQVPQDAHLSIQMELTVNLSLPHIQQELKSLCSRSHVVALIVDPFAHKALDFAKELNLLCYIYVPLAAMTLSLYFYAPKLDQILSSEKRDPQEPIQFPGCVPLPSRDRPSTLHDRSSIAYKSFLERAKSVYLPNGIFLNSFLELESGAITAMQEQIKGNGPQIYAVGPIIQSGSISNQNGSDCLGWLDAQEPNSVLYVSFGSGGTLSQKQFNELALGLELSGQKFLWVVRAPNDVASVAYFGTNIEDPLSCLPHGFLERTKNQGLVVPTWGPQIQILGHNSTGGFLTHCGWNSVLESIVHGVALIAWPLFAEQGLNAVLLSDGLKVAVRPKVNEGGLVERDEIAKVVRGLMQTEGGIDIRTRMEYFKNAAANALKEDGSSTKAMAEAVVNWRGS